jgi:hypothetical protein
MKQSEVEVKLLGDNDKAGSDEDDNGGKVEEVFGRDGANLTEVMTSIQKGLLELGFVLLHPNQLRLVGRKDDGVYVTVDAGGREQYSFQVCIMNGGKNGREICDRIGAWIS